ncbi:cytochrome B6 [Prochlorococcus marinus]|uniref:cytochrome B6 n=1 Tax=Prochlorococcus marinus TaxID=1219 RepID=UPI0022B42CAD|nr:cytochrome B6 [Prochlorococcus marinus]
MTFNFLHLYFLFTTNNDVQNLLIFGHNINTWLIYVLIFFGLTSLAFVLVWFTGFLVESKSGQSIKQPWE